MTSAADSRLFAAGRMVLFGHDPVEVRVLLAALPALVPRHALRLHVAM